MDKLLPFAVFLQMPPENIIGTGRGFLRGMKQGHPGLLQLPSTLAMVTGWTCGYHIRPDMFAAQVFGPDMVNGQVIGAPSAILADVFVPAKNLTAGQFDMYARAVNHLVQADDGGYRYSLSNCPNIAATIHDQIGFP